MKWMISSILVAAFAGLIVTPDAFAKPPKAGRPAPEKVGKHKHPAKDKILEKFDEDGDGKLSPAERAKAKAWKDAKKAEKGQKEGAGGKKPAKHKKGNRHGLPA